MIGYLDVTLDYMMTVDIRDVLPRKWKVIGSLPTASNHLRLVITDTDNERHNGFAFHLKRMKMTVVDDGDTRTVKVEVDDTPGLYARPKSAGEVAS